MSVKLTDVIGEAYYDCHWDIIEGKHTYYDLYGGRGSLKSSFASVEIVLGMMKDQDANAVVYRKVADTIGGSTYEQIVWAIDALGVSDKWHCTVSPFRCIYKKTGQKIIFKGLDKAKKSKSIKVAKGYFKYLWFEEWDEYDGMEEIRSVQQSVLRGGKHYVVFRTMNPPKAKNSWANKEIERDKLRKDVYVLHATYLDAPKQWLGDQFIADAEWLKEINPKAYEHEYMGLAVGIGCEVFDNVNAFDMSDDMITGFDRRYMGIDWGWYPDPFHWGNMHYDKARNNLYIFDEWRCFKTKNKDTWQYLHDKKGVRNIDLITADSAEEKSVADYRSYGSNCRAAEKGPDSVRYGTKWLQSLNHIYIDPRRCPKTFEEFTEYQYELTKDGEPTGSMPDANNHSIDMTRYAMERVWKRRGA